jgi:PhnB protein
MQTSAHLHFKGNCRQAFEFYAQLFGGSIPFALTYGEAPGAEQVPLAVRSHIAHARLDLGEQMLLGCDVTGERYQTPQGFNVMAAVDEPAEAERVFNALSQSGSITMPFQETFWAKRFGMCTDRFGIPWMVNCPKPPEAVAGAARSAA